MTPKKKNQISNKFLTFMLDRCFSMLLCFPSGGGKANLLLYTSYRFLYFNNINLYSNNILLLVDVLLPLLIFILFVYLFYPFNCFPIHVPIFCLSVELNKYPLT